MKDYILFKDLDDKYMTMKEYLETVDTPEAEVVEKGEEDKDSEPQEPPKTVIYYVTDRKQQSQYFSKFSRSVLHIPVNLSATFFVM